MPRLYGIPDLVSAVVVLQAFDVIFPEIVPGLDLDEDHGFGADVLDAVGAFTRDIDVLADRKDARHAVDRHARGAAVDEPVLFAPLVALEAQSLGRVDRDLLDLVVSPVEQDHVGAPGAFADRDEIFALVFLVHRVFSFPEWAINKKYKNQAEPHISGATV